jgi:integrase/recombinase XerD
MNINEAFTKFIKYQEANNSPATVEAYINRTATFRLGFGDRLYAIVDLPASITAVDYLLNGHGNREVTAVTPENVDDWLWVQKHQHTLYEGNIRANVGGGLSAATLQGRVQSLKYFFTFCEERAYLVANPAAHIRISKARKRDHVREKKMRMYDLYRLLDAATARAAHGQPRDLAILSLMVESGARPGEIVSLNVVDLDLEQGTAVVCGKTGSRRIVFTPHTARNLEKWLDFRQLVTAVATAADSDALFINIWHPGMGKRISTNTISLLFQRIREEAKVEGTCNPYSVRHLVGHHLAMQPGVPLPLVQEVMGHEDVNTTMIYVHPQMEQVKAVITLHSPLNEYYSGK